MTFLPSEACIQAASQPRSVLLKIYLSCLFYTERDLPDGLDQKIITWELVQKENYLANLEQMTKESNEERLKKTSNKYISINLSTFLTWPFDASNGQTL